MTTKTSFLLRRGALLPVLLAAACVDNDLPTAPGPAPVANATIPPTQSGPDMPTIDRFTLSMRADGTFRPGEPIRIAIDATSNLPTDAAELRVVLPEVELAKASSWGETFSYRSQAPLPSVASRSFTRLGSGARATEQASITIPAPGYYRVVATLKASDDAPIVYEGRWVRNTAVAELWLLVTSAGGMATADFDPSRVPSGRVRNPGPFRARSLASGAVRGQDGLREPDSDLPQSMLTPGLITYHAEYYDNDAMQYLPVPGSHFVIYNCTVPPGQFICDPEDWQQFTSGDANGSGDFAFQCSGDSYETDVATHAGLNYFQVVNGANAVDGDVATDCGGTFDIVLPSAHARVFLNMQKTYDGFVALFGSARSFIEIRIASSGTSHYSPGNDDITIVSPGDVWGANRGPFTMAHEYGHAFHEETLWGNNGSPCSDHFLDTESSLGCVFSEGFADYAGASTRPDLASYSYRTTIEADYYFPGCVARQTSPPYTCIGGTPHTKARSSRVPTQPSSTISRMGWPKFTI